MRRKPIFGMLFAALLVMTLIFTACSPAPNDAPEEPAATDEPAATNDPLSAEQRALLDSADFVLKAGRTDGVPYETELLPFDETKLELLSVFNDRDDDADAVGQGFLSYYPFRVLAFGGTTEIYWLTRYIAGDAIGVGASTGVTIQTVHLDEGNVSVSNASVDVGRSNAVSFTPSSTGGTWSYAADVSDPAAVCRMLLWQDDALFLFTPQNDGETVFTLAYTEATGTVCEAVCTVSVEGGDMQLTLVSDALQNTMHADDD